MKIDRHNYEEYFLLYIDNELTVEQKRQVDLFVKDNPDLEQEMVLLKQAKLIPDSSIVFNKKELLNREENDSFIHLGNYEEWLVLYVDDELRSEERSVVEKFAAAHPQVQQQLALFLQTKLQPETLVFDNKDVLYRKERATIISMQWWRVAVAAILIIAAGVGLYSLLQRGNTNGRGSDFAVNKAGQAQSSSKTEPLPTSPQTGDHSTPGVIDKPTTVSHNGANERQAAYAVRNKRAGSENKKTAEPDRVQLLAINNEAPIHQNIVTEIREVQTLPRMNAVVAVDNKTLKEKISDGSVTKEPTGTPQPVYASNTESKKLRGFFRKATRIFEHTTNINPANDDNRVLIGGMAFNLR